MNFTFLKDETLRLCSSRGLTIHLPNMDTPFQREVDLLLRPMAAFETVTFPLKILADLGFTSSKEATFIEHKVCEVIKFRFFSALIMFSDLFLVVSTLSMDFKNSTCIGSTSERIRSFYRSVQASHCIHKKVCKYAY